MQSHFNLGHAVLNQATQSPGDVAILGDHSLTYSQLSKRITAFATRMHSSGISRGATVAVNAPAPIDALVICLALGLLGARWVQLAPTLPKSLGLTHIVSSEKPKTPVGMRTLIVDQSWFASDIREPPMQAFGGFGSASDVFCFTHSSGTTGLPKYMAYTCEIIAALLPNYLGDFASTFTAFPPMAIPGLLASVAALRSKQTLVLAARSAAELGQIGVEHVYAPPALVDRLCDGQQPSARLRLLSTAGSIVTGGTASRWSGYFQELRIAYGSYEAGVCGFADLTTLSERQDSAQLAYQLLPGVHAEVVDKNDICLPPQSEGILRLKTPWMVSGYIDAPEDSAQTFRDGWFYPGDLAVLDADGLLTITGRLKDQLNFGGVKVSGDILDAAIRKADGLADGIAFALQQPHGPDIFCVLAVLASGAEPTQVAARVRRACSSLGPRVLVPRHIYFVESLPLSERGKVMRNAAAAASLSAAPF